MTHLLEGFSENTFDLNDSNDFYSIMDSDCQIYKNKRAVEGQL